MSKFKYRTFNTITPPLLPKLNAVARTRMYGCQPEILIPMEIMFLNTAISLRDIQIKFLKVRHYRCQDIVGAITLLNRGPKF